jgi:hypothetical protein
LEHPIGLGALEQVVSDEEVAEGVAEPVLQALDPFCETWILGEIAKQEATGYEKVGDLIDVDALTEVVSRKGSQRIHHLFGIAGHPAPSLGMQLAQVFRGVLEEMDLNAAEEIVGKAELGRILRVDLEVRAER